MIVVDMAAGIAERDFDSRHDVASRLRRREATEPAITKRRGSLDGGLGLAADPDGNRALRSWRNARVLVLEVLALKRNVILGQ